ncbi:hypothetical protein T4B_3719 [Trichinella pseudospiralis]|uniref:Uncharacterized protein n=1 Tax=Trichinella pseudospiralis TaxID=6337 RepID=A0A0V1IA46_TRIPS|nr:hypothetical protein T4B_3719 [Trichinella pseudospiralis]
MTNHVSVITRLTLYEYDHLLKMSIKVVMVSIIIISTFPIEHRFMCIVLSNYIKTALPLKISNIAIEEDKEEVITTPEGKRH